MSLLIKSDVELQSEFQVITRPAHFAVNFRNTPLFKIARPKPGGRMFESARRKLGAGGRG
jgi:hypothetical protein